METKKETRGSVTIAANHLYKERQCYYCHKLYVRKKETLDNMKQTFHTIST
jgi:hypothetical protein